MSPTGRRHRDTRYRALVARGILNQHGNLTDRGEQYAEERYDRASWEPPAEFDDMGSGHGWAPEPMGGGMTV